MTPLLGDLTVHVNPLLSRAFTWHLKSYFLQKINVNKTFEKCRLLQFLFGAFRIKFQGDWFVYIVSVRISVVFEKSVFYICPLLICFMYVTEKRRRGLKCFIGAQTPALALLLMFSILCQCKSMRTSWLLTQLTLFITYLLCTVYCDIY